MLETILIKYLDPASAIFNHTVLRHVVKRIEKSLRQGLNIHSILYSLSISVETLTLSFKESYKTIKSF